MICHLCKVVDYNNHSVETIDGALTRTIPKIKENLKKLATIKEEHVERIVELNDLLDQNINREEHLKNEAKKHLDDVIAQARTQYETIVREIEEKREKEKEKVMDEIKKWKSRWS